MKKIIIYIAALSLMAAACNKAELNPAKGGEEPAPAANMIIETISGTTEMDTKATISDTDGAFAWTIGDNIAVHVSKGGIHKYVLTSDSEHGASGASAATRTAYFKIAYEEGYSRDAFAVYPSNIVDEGASDYGDGGLLKVTLPSSYKLSEVSGETTPCPMIATNTPGSYWDFKQLCGLLRLTVNNIPPSAKRLEIDFNGNKVWGDFSVASTVTPETSVISTSSDDAHDIIMINKDGTDVKMNGGAWLDNLKLNIPLPVGEYTSITITAYDTYDTGGNAVLTMTRTLKNGTASYTATRKGGVKRIASFPVFSINGSKPDPSQASQTKRVIFSPGNLQAEYNKSTKTWTWKFANQQYDFIGNAVGNTKVATDLKETSAPYALLKDGSEEINGSVDLFSRSTAATYYGISNSTTALNYVGDFVDWGSITTFNWRENSKTYSTGYWKTFSCTDGDLDDPKNEWAWIMRKRNTNVVVNETSSARYTKATITLNNSTTVNGVILFPDSYDGGTPTGVVWGTINGQSSNWTTTCTQSGWEKLEAAGCVFLPASGKRSGSSVSDVNTRGYYWVSTVRYPGTGQSNFLIFEDGNVYWNHTLYLSNQCSVRLVHEVN